MVHSNPVALYQLKASKAEDMRLDTLVERPRVADFHFEGSDSGDFLSVEDVENAFHAEGKTFETGGAPSERI
jgi:hypothetical protein